MSMQEKILEEIERMQKGSRAKLEAKLNERHAILCNLIPINERIDIGSPLFAKGPLYWKAIIVEESGERRRYRVSEYLKL